MSITASVSTLPSVGSPLRLAPVTNLERMYALDEASNARDWETNNVKHPYDVLFGDAEFTDGSAQWSSPTSSPSERSEPLTAGTHRTFM